MASLKISGFTTGTSALSTDKIPVERSGANVYITPAMIKNLNQVQCNFAATTNPAATDDVNAGYAVGSEWINLTLGQRWICFDATASAAKWSMIDSHPGYKSGLYYPTFVGTPINTVTPSAKDQIILYPFRWYGLASIQKFASRVQSTQASSSTALKWGLWANSSSTNRPTGTALIYDNTGVALADGGGATNPETAGTSSLGTLHAGNYWIGTKWTWNAALAPTVWGLGTTTSYDITHMQGISSIGVTGVGGLTFADTFSNNIGTTNLTGGSFTEVTATGTVPLIYMKIV